MSRTENRVVCYPVIEEEISIFNTDARCNEWRSRNKAEAEFNLFNHFKLTSGMDFNVLYARFNQIDTEDGIIVYPAGESRSLMEQAVPFSPSDWKRQMIPSSKNRNKSIFSLIFLTFTAQTLKLKSLQTLKQLQSMWPGK